LSKFALILAVILIAWSCSVSRKTGAGTGERSAENFSFKELTAHNLSGRDFIIRKAEISFNSEEYSGKFFAVIKFKYPSDWLISIRGSTGIEAARAYINHDTIMINERLHRKLYCGNSSGLKRKFGVNNSMSPLILGDYLGNKEDSAKINNCKDGKSVTEIIREETRLDYIIDCAEVKVIQTRIAFSGEYGEIFFSRFRRKNNICYPGVVEMKSGKMTISIKIPKGNIEFTTIDSLLFVAGAGYEKLLLR
jgi:hypothetical protein